ncbi:MAG: helix-turn-helix domain-containing protein [Candidatus Methylacidiphilales bacterium]
MTVDEAVKKITDLKHSINVDNISLTINITVSKTPQIINTNAKIKFIEEVLKMLEDETGITVYQIKQQNRKREIAEVRQILFYILRYSRFGFGVSELGRFFERDHTTIVHSVKCVNNLMATDYEYKQYVEKLIFKASIL